MSRVPNHYVCKCKYQRILYILRIEECVFIYSWIYIGLGGMYGVMCTHIGLPTCMYVFINRNINAYIKYEYKCMYVFHILYIKKQILRMQLTMYVCIMYGGCVCMYMCMNIYASRYFCIYIYIYVWLVNGDY